MSTAAEFPGHRDVRQHADCPAAGITPQNLAVLRTGRAKAIRFTTLEAICHHPDCQPGDILEHQPSDPNESSN